MEPRAIGGVDVNTAQNLMLDDTESDCRESLLPLCGY